VVRGRETTIHQVRILLGVNGHGRWEMYDTSLVEEVVLETLDKEDK